MLAKAIAIIDDEADLVNLFREALEKDGFSASTFTDPVQALDHVRENPYKYSIILSDFHMPKLDGCELCMKLISLNPDLKIILMSAYENISYDTSRFIFLSKPILIARLLTVVKEILVEQPKITSKLE
jgi:DNA-binding NtrC family response regulator